MAVMCNVLTTMVSRTGAAIIQMTPAPVRYVSQQLHHARAHTHTHAHTYQRTPKLSRLLLVVLFFYCCCHKPETVNNYTQTQSTVPPLDGRALPAAVPEGSCAVIDLSAAMADLLQTAKTSPFISSYLLIL